MHLSRKCQFTPGFHTGSSGRETAVLDALTDYRYRLMVRL